MVVYCVNVYVKKGNEEDFLAATKKNHIYTRKEPGNIRFDVIQSEENPSDFFLYEVYEDEHAVKSHKLTPHYQKWRETVAPWMAKDREGKKFSVRYPSKQEQW